jgi:hypothetical protein
MDSGLLTRLRQFIPERKMSTPRFPALVLSLALSSALGAQTLAPDKPHETGTRPPVKPAPVPHDVSAPAISALAQPHGFNSVQVNVNGEGLNIVGDAANEPSIAVDPLDPSRIVIGWRQFDTIASDFREAGVGYSHDGGQSWTFSGVIDDGVFRSDPVLMADNLGNFYYYSLYTDLGSNWRCDLFASTDGGMSWGPPTFAYGGDKAWPEMDNNGSLSDGHIYVAWNIAGNEYYPRTFNRSIDRGENFEYPIEIPPRPKFGTVAIGPDSELYVIGVTSYSQFYVLRSDNAQNPQETPEFNSATSVNLGGSMEISTGPNPAGLLGQAWIAVDHSDGPTRGNVYALCSASPPGSDPLDIMFAKSTDGGQTFSAPVRLNDDDPGTNAWQWFGTMAVAPDGRIDVVWNDTRNDPGADFSELYYTFSTDAGETWSENLAVSPPFNHYLGYPQNNKLGDYYDMISVEAGAHVAYAATFNGEQDVYYVFVEPVLPLLSFTYPDGRPELVDPAGGAEFIVEVTSNAGEPQPETGLLYVDNGDGFAPYAMTHLGENVYEAVFPETECRTEVRYYLSVETTLGEVVTDPASAPDAFYSAFSGVGVITLFADDFETDTGWTEENLGATSGDWQRGVPVNDPGWEYDPPADSDGSGQCYLTQNETGNTDVDDGSVRLTSPLFDLSDGGAVAYDYYLYLTESGDGVDRLLVEINSEGGSGNWIEVARHVTSGGLNWRHHEITGAELIAEGVDLTDAMQMRFTANDADPQSIVEGGVDAFLISAIDCGTECPADFDGDGDVDVADLLFLLSAWGTPGGDVDGDGDTDAADLLALLAAWGECP